MGSLFQGLILGISAYFLTFQLGIVAQSPASGLALMILTWVLQAWIWVVAFGLTLRGCFLLRKGYFEIVTAVFFGPTRRVRMNSTPEGRVIYHKSAKEFVLLAALDSMTPGVHSILQSRIQYLAQRTSRGYSPKDEITFDRLNLVRREVEGWRYALQEGIISPNDLLKGDPSELQARIDLANPLLDELEKVKHFISIFEGSEDVEQQRLYRELVARRIQLREQPKEIFRKAQVAQAKSAVEAADEALQAVRELTED